MHSNNITLITFLFFSFLIYAQNDKLQQVKQNLAKKQDMQVYITDVKQKQDQKTHSNPFKELLAQIFWNITYGIAVETIFEKESKMHDASISKYSYIEDKTGNFTYNDSLSVISRLLITDSFLRESNSIKGNNLNLKHQFFKRFAVEFGYLELIEKTNRRKDHFSLFSFMANYYRIRTKRLDAWYGIGAMYVANDINKFGLAFGAGAEWFVKKPISLYASIKSGIINQESLTKSKIQLKYYQKRAQFIIGYQNFKLTTISVNSVSLGFGYQL
ncbi:MAG TPA: hypothetical protein ENK67_08260 [Flavobacteriia bacterium]|jgi:hypothetical protein|nr:hypothetical protein [Flavobacteriia bacterium]